MSQVGFMKRLLDEHGDEGRGGGEDLERVERLEVPDHLHEWLEKRVGKSIEEITLDDLLELPRRKDLRYADVTSPLGGRRAAHLRHLDPAEDADLFERGSRFLDETADEELGPEDLEPDSAGLAIEHE